MMLMLFMLMLLPSFAFAATPASSGDICTAFSDAKTKAASDTSTTGLLTDIYYFIKGVVGDATRNLFLAFTGSSAYQSALGAVFILVVVFFGVTFMTGVGQQPSFAEILKRLIKLGVVMALISPMGWIYFNDTIVSFFNDGTDDLVKAVNSIGTGIPTPIGASPFFQLDKIASVLVQPDVLVMIMSSLFTSGPYGLAMGGLMSIALIGFIKLLVDALKIYAVCFVARSMLLGLAPIFFTFMLFEKTKQLFLQWVNVLVAMSLQPILMFTFLSFFTILIQNAAFDMLSTDVCWTDCKVVDGAQNSMSCWRPQDDQKQVIKSEMSWNGAVSCLVGGSGNCPEFPFNIVDILSFLILVFIAQRFSDQIILIANDLAGVQVNLSQGPQSAQFGKGIQESISKAFGGGKKPG
jgi:type IV secretory pathway VirB6-like protein